MINGIYILIALAIIIAIFSSRKKIEKIILIKSNFEEKERLIKIFNFLLVIIMYLAHLFFIYHTFYDTIWLPLKESPYFGYIIFASFISVFIYAFYRLDFYTSKGIINKLIYLIVLFIVGTFLNHYQKTNKVPLVGKFDKTIREIKNFFGKEDDAEVIILDKNDQEDLDNKKTKMDLPKPEPSTSFLWELVQDKAISLKPNKIVLIKISFNCFSSPPAIKLLWDFNKPINLAITTIDNQGNVQEGIVKVDLEENVINIPPLVNESNKIYIKNLRQETIKFFYGPIEKEDESKIQISYVYL